MPAKTSHHLYPPFPDDLATAPLTTISLAKLENSDGAESTAFFDACRNLGFFYLDTEGSILGDCLVEEAEQLHNLQQQFFKLPHETKEQFSREKVDPFFGYRFGLMDTKEDDGTPRRNETYNVWMTARRSSANGFADGACRCAKTTSSPTATLSRIQTSSNSTGLSYNPTPATAAQPSTL